MRGVGRNGRSVWRYSDDVPARTDRIAHYDPRIDAADFGRPMLQRLRDIVHQACAEVDETLKWGIPSFQYAGVILCTMGAFKHVSFGFWKHAWVMDHAERDGAALEK